MSQYFILNFGVALIAGIGVLAFFASLVGLAIAKFRRPARTLLISTAIGGPLGALGFKGLASLTNTSPPDIAVGVALLSGAGVAALAWMAFRVIFANNPNLPAQSE
jgi:hypothetical protein